MDSLNNACKFGSDAWLELQAFKTRQLNRREKLNRHKNLRKDLFKGVAHGQQPGDLSGTSSSLLTTNNSNNPAANRASKQSSSSLANLNNQPKSSAKSTDSPNEEYLSSSNNSNGQTNHSIDCRTALDDDSPPIILYDNIQAPTDLDQNNLNLELIECLLLLKLCDVALKLPIDSKSLQRSICRIRGLENSPRSLIENLLQKFAHQELITLEEPTSALLNRRTNQIIGTGAAVGGDDEQDDDSCIYITAADHTKLVEFDKSFGSLDSIRALLIESKSEDQSIDECDISVPIQTIRTSTNNSCSYSERSDESFLKVNLEHFKDTRHQQQPHDSKDVIDLDASANAKASQSNIKKQVGEDLESLLSLSSTRERESKKLGEELLELLSKPTAKEKNLLERFRSADGYQVQEFCPKGTKGECIRNNKGSGACNKLHFKKIIAKHTEESLGDCSFLNTCFHMDSCKYVHYEVDYDEKQQPQFKRPHPAKPQGSNNNNSRNNNYHNNKNKQHNGSSVKTDDRTSPSTPSTTTSQDNNNDSNNNNSKTTAASLTLPQVVGGRPSKYALSPEEQARIDAKNCKRFKTVLYPPQWIQCDLRFFDMSLLGKFSVVMADPPWDIHMELPYGTMSDDEMRKLNIPALQDEGVIFLWVTGRAMELGRECLALWGYERCDEIIWVKTNQLQRIIRTGRTGHWLNHGKEHCLVGVKGNPKDINRGLDCDVIVAEVRATSHKPDEIYGIIERLSPGTRKIELFGRAHNVQPNWMTLGNQLDGVRLVEPSLVNAFKKLNLPFQTGEDV